MKKSIAKSGIILFIISIIMVILILFFYNKEITSITSQNIKLALEEPGVEKIKRDTVISLITNFCQLHNSKLVIKNPNDKDSLYIQINNIRDPESILGLDKRKLLSVQHSHFKIIEEKSSLIMSFEVENRDEKFVYVPLDILYQLIKDYKKK